MSVSRTRLKPISPKDDRDLQAELAAASKATQTELAQAERAAQAAFSVEQRSLDKAEQRFAIARNAAVGLLGRLGDLDAVIPYLPSLRKGSLATGETVNVIASRAEFARQSSNAFRGALRTDLLLITDAEVVARYRALANLSYELANSPSLGLALADGRAIGDVQNYAKYVVYSLNQFIDDKPLLDHAAPPILLRDLKDGGSWLPDTVPVDWDKI